MVYVPSKIRQGQLKQLIVAGRLDDYPEYRSSFRAGLDDARRVAQRNSKGTVQQVQERTAIWAGALLYLALVDQVGAAFTLDRALDAKLVDGKGKTKKEGVRDRFLRALEEHVSDLDVDRRLALWGLRNSFAHNYSAVNAEGDAGSCHVFELDWTTDTSRPGIDFAPEAIRWDGQQLSDYDRSVHKPTWVNLRAVEDWGEQVAASVEDKVRDKELLLTVGTWREFLVRFTIHVEPRPVIATFMETASPSVSGAGPDEIAAMRRQLADANPAPSGFASLRGGRRSPGIAGIPPPIG